MAKSLRFGNGKQCGGASVAACNHPFPFPFYTKTSEIQEMNKEMRFLNIEVVDDIALIDTSLFSSNPKKINRRQQIKNPQRPRSRKDWKIKNKKAVYSRAEMLALSFQNVDDQNNEWSQVYAALPAPVAAEYDGLLAQPPTPFFPNFDAVGKRRPRKISVH